MREVKREAKAAQRSRERAAAAGLEPHRAYLAGPPDRPPRRVRSERGRTAPGRRHRRWRSCRGCVYVQIVPRHGRAARRPPGRLATDRPSNDPTPGSTRPRRAARAPARVEDQPRPLRVHARPQTGSTAPVAYDPCRPIRYVVRTGARAARGRAAPRRERPGHRDRRDRAAPSCPTAGTDETRRVDRELFQPATLRRPVGARAHRVADRQRRTRGSSGRSIGRGGSSSASVGRRAAGLRHGQRRSSTPTGSPADARARRRATREAEAVVLHELGHVLGLGARDATSRRSCSRRRRPQVTAYAAGDLAGLAKLGGGACETAALSRSGPERSRPRVTMGCPDARRAP